MELSRYVFGTTIVLLLIILLVSSASAIRVTFTTNTDFIRTSCSKTTYPQLCFSSLSSRASVIQTNPKLLVIEALNLTLVKARSISSLMVRLSKISSLKPREVGAITDCVEELADTVDEIERSIAEMNGSSSSRNPNDFQFLISNVETWMSAALTDETTCSDGFAGDAMNGNLKTIVRNNIGEISQMTSNTLALINQYASKG